MKHLLSFSAGPFLTPVPYYTLKHAETFSLTASLTTLCYGDVHCQIDQPTWQASVQILRNPSLDGSKQPSQPGQPYEHNEHPACTAAARPHRRLCTGERGKAPERPGGGCAMELVQGPSSTAAGLAEGLRARQPNHRPPPPRVWRRCRGPVRR